MFSYSKGCNCTHASTQGKKWFACLVWHQIIFGRFGGLKNPPFLYVHCACAQRRRPFDGSPWKHSGRLPNGLRLRRLSPAEPLSRPRAKSLRRTLRRVRIHDADNGVAHTCNLRLYKRRKNRLFRFPSTKCDARRR